MLNSEVSSDVGTSVGKTALLELPQILTAESWVSLQLSIWSFSVVYLKQTVSNHQIIGLNAIAVGVIIEQLYFYFVADAFFKAAVSLVPEVPKTISIDGKMRPSDAFLLEFLCNFFSTLLVVPVSHCVCVFVCVLYINSIQPSRLSCLKVYCRFWFNLKFSIVQWDKNVKFLEYYLECAASQFWPKSTVRWSHGYISS